MKIFCVIPSWNQANTLEKVVNDVSKFCDNIVIVDDGSTDQTKEVVKNLPAHFISHAINRGQGAALKTGTQFAKEYGADIVVHFDADGQFRAEDLQKIVAPIINNQAQIVFGSRFLDTTTKMPEFKKKFIMPLARFINKYVFRINLTDPQSGFRALGPLALQEIDWRQDRMAHCSEILVAAHRSGLTIAEVPITVIYHEFGQKIGGGLKILRDLFLSKLNN